MLKMKEKSLIESQSSSQIFTILSDIPSEINNIDDLIETSIRVASSVNKSLLDVSRRKHQAYLMAQNGSIINPANYQSLPLIKERAQFRTGGESGKSVVENKGKNLLKMIRRSFRNGLNDVNNNSGQTNRNQVRSLANEDVEDPGEAKLKNITQTEFLVNLREVILKIAHHFEARDPENYSNILINADYSVESHSRDYERYMDTSKVRIYYKL